MWPVRADLITLRVCADLDWTVTVRCPRCGVGTMLHASKLAEGKLGARPLHELLARGALKCRKPGCDGAPASSLDVSCMDVGILKSVARWEKS